MRIIENTLGVQNPSFETGKDENQAFLDKSMAGTAKSIIDMTFLLQRYPKWLHIDEH